MEEIKNKEIVNEENEQALDDARRVKIVSPTMLVIKRFVRNKLAIVGTAILVVLFLFCFLGPLVYPYSQSDIFTTYKEQLFDYAVANQKTAYDNNFFDENVDIDSSMISMTNSYVINDMIPNDLTVKNDIEDTQGNNYILTKLNNGVYLFSFDGYEKVFELIGKATIGTYKISSGVYSFTYTDGTNDETLNGLLSAAGRNKEVEYGGNKYILNGTKMSGNVICTYATPTLSPDYTGIEQALVDAAISNKNNVSFVYNAKNYKITSSDGNYIVKENEVFDICTVTNLVINFDKDADSYSDSFLANALLALGNMTGSTQNFSFNTKDYIIKNEEGKNNIYEVSGSDEIFIGLYSNFSAKRYNGEDTISIAIKERMEEIITYMKANNLQEYTALINTQKLVLNVEKDIIEPVYEEDGITPVMDDVEFTILIRNNTYVFRNIQQKYVADINADPSPDHILGLDGNGMDVFARIMYGGRISLVIGFIVVIIEVVLGTIMGGISGYFGGIVDNLIMRIVDIFYCIPSMPILIIFGALFDNLNLGNYERLGWMMAIIGFLGWPGIARLVRGQILSLREQDFMVAAEACGLSNSRRIFRHLVPNVMPQLIVQATMGLGSVILTESTLSFLGLGVKFPIATWGQIINSVSSISDMIKYTYIWIPVGCLICLAVIAFNFVGDGLRDAFDPKMKR